MTTNAIARRLLPAILLSLTATTAKGAQAPAPAVPAGGAIAIVKGARVPLFDPAAGATPIASVGSDVVALRELAEVLAVSHGERTGENPAGKQNFLSIVDRLVVVRLLAAEAREMGIDELPETKAAIARFEEQTLRRMAKERASAGVRPDPKWVEKRYRDEVRQYLTRSLVFETEGAAREAQALVLAGKPFAEVAKELVDQKKAKGSLEVQPLPRDQMLPDVLARVEKLQVGKVSAPFRVSNGWALVIVEGFRYPDDPQVRANIEEASRNMRIEEARRKHYKALRAKYASVDETLLRKLDFQAKKPGLPALQKDPRVLARIRGSSRPVTVADLANEVQAAYYHGAERAADKGKVNQEKIARFDSLLYGRLLDREAVELKLAETEAFKLQVKEFVTTRLFDEFVRRAILSDAAPKEAEVQRYYEAHKADFGSPLMYRLQATAFATAKEAESAASRLRAGTDFRWLVDNAEGQVPADKRSVEFPLAPVTASTLPAGLEKVLTGARGGETRTWEKGPGEVYVVRVVAVVPPAAQPLEAVREAVSVRVFQENMNRSVAEWGAKLRQHRDVQIYITEIL